MHRILKKLARLKLFLLALIVSANTCNAQFFEQTPLHLFKDRNSNPITCGKVIDLDDNKIKVQNGLGKQIVILIKDLESEDQRFVKSIRTSLKVFQKQKLDADKSFLRLDSNSPAIKKKALKKIESQGNAAQHLSKDLAELTLKTENVQLAGLTLLTFMKVCPKNDISFNRIFFILEKRRDLAKQIEQSPLEFLEHLARFGPKADQLLIQVSYSGELVFFDKNTENIDSPKLLTTTNGPKNQVRAMGCQSLAQIRTANANNAILAVANTAATPINGRIDRSTILSILIGLKAAGRANSTFATFPATIKSEFPREFQAWLIAYKQIQNYEREQAKLLESSKMQNFHNRNGKFLVRGNVAKIEDGRVLIIDVDQKQYAVEITQLSTTDQERILKANN